MWSEIIGMVSGAAGKSSAPPPVNNTSGGHAFDNQLQDFGAGDWNINFGGNGPQDTQAFQRPRADAYVLGLAGLSTTGAGTAVGNGTTVQQPAAVTNSILQNNPMWLALAVAAVGIVWVMGKGNK